MPRSSGQTVIKRCRGSSWSARRISPIKSDKSGERRQQRYVKSARVARGAPREHVKKELRSLVRAQAIGPQPHPNIIGVFSQASFSGAVGEVARARQDG